MHIAYVNNHYQLGGAETVMRQLHEGMIQAGQRSTIIVTEGKKYPRGGGVRPLYPRMLSKLDHSRLRPLVRKVAPRPRWTDSAFRQLARSPYDLIHIHSFHGIYASIESLAYLVHAKPVVWTFHRFWGVTGGCDHPFGCTRFQSGCGDCPQVGNFAVGPVDRTFEEWKLKMSLLRNLPLTIISPSRHLEKVVRESPIGQLWDTIVIPNGIDTDAFESHRKSNPSFRHSLGIDPQKVSILFTNRNFCDPIKGWPVIRDALLEVQDQNLQVMLVGEGAAWAASQLPPSIDTIVYGYITDRKKMAQIYEAADIFLYASAGENFPCAILEAMASGCCVISTPVDGVIEQVVSGCSGLLSDAMDSHSLARSLKFALEHPIRIAELGRSARDLVMRSFSEEVMIQSHLSLYMRVLDNASYSKGY